MFRQQHTCLFICNCIFLSLTNRNKIKHFPKIYPDTIPKWIAIDEEEKIK